jgi:NTE family protein
MAAKKVRSKQRSVNLALQGGGAHGAFTWGAIDAMLEDGRIDIEAVSATSAGAMNAVVLADALSSGDRDTARERLAAFWQAIAAAGRQWNPVQVFDVGLPIEQTPAYWMFDAMVRVFSPYQLNPLNFNPLRKLLEEHVDFERLRRTKGVSIHLCATNVETGKVRIFERHEVSVDAVLASACLPFLFQTVEIEGAHYWDGGYIGNPAIFPLIYQSRSCDVVIVHVNPIVRRGVPTTAPEIMNRINEISFNSSLTRDARDSLRHQADRRRQDTAIHIRAACRSEQHRLASRTRLVLGAVETWIALWLIGVPVSPIEAVILESLTQALRAAAFPVPSALGVQEGGFTVLGALFGIPPAAALALSFVKRVPDLAIGLPGLLA